MKERKTGNKFTIFLLSCIVVFASVWAGRTYAYFTASNNASGTITMGTLQLNGVTDSTSAQDSLKVVPNQTVSKTYETTVNSNVSYYTRIMFKAGVTVAGGKTHKAGCGDNVANDTEIMDITVAGTSGQTSTTYTKYGTLTDDGYAVYYKLSPTTPNDNTNTIETFLTNLKLYDWVGAGGCDYYMGATISLNIRVEVIQADYLESDTIGAIYTSVDDLHNIWQECGESLDMEEVQDVSFYADKLEFEVLSEENKTMSVKQASGTSTASLSVDDNTPVASGLTKIKTNNVGESSDTTLTIPARVKKNGITYTVTEIVGGVWSDCGFQYCGYSQINLPNTLTYIGQEAFYGCSNLISIDIPNGVIEIGAYVFRGCSSLTSVTIPNSVTSMGYGVFRGCSSLTYNIYNNIRYLGNSSNPYLVLISPISTNITSCEINSNCKIVYQEAFDSCKSLSYNVYDNAKYLGNSSNPHLILMEIAETSITNCEINPNCKIINKWAFRRCSNLTSITIPCSVTSVGSGAFLYCSNLTEINVASENVSYKSVDGVLFNKDGSSLITYPIGKTDTSYVIPNGVLKIESYAFEGCKSLTEVSIPSSVKTIGESAFYYCSNLISLSLPSGLETIGTYAFATKGDDSESETIIMYNGTKQQMSTIHQTTQVSSGMICYTIICTDGEYKVQQDLICLWIDTEIDCWDEKRKRRYKKKLKDLTYDDDILVWDFDRGCFATAKAMFITRPQMAKAYTLTTFSDGTTLKTIGADDSKRHRLFNVDTGKFEYIGTNMKIGTRTFNSKGEIVTIVDMKFVRDDIEYCNVITEYHMNVFANGILTSIGLNNLYPIKDMKFVKDDRDLNKQEDYPDIEPLYFNGLRLAEQRIDGNNMSVGDFTDYVNWRKSMSKER